MWFRVLSAVVAGLAGWSAALQLNDPDPVRWFALYAGGCAVAGLEALGRPRPQLSAAVGAVALAWALSIVPALFGVWQPADLTATMDPDRPEIELGRELGGLTIVATYCFAAFYRARRLTGRAARPGHGAVLPRDEHS